MKQRLVLIAMLTAAVLAAAFVAVGGRAAGGASPQRLAGNGKTVLHDGFWDGHKQGLG